MKPTVQKSFVVLLLAFLFGLVGKSEFLPESFLLLPTWILVNVNIFRRERFYDASERHLGWCVVSWNVNQEKNEMECIFRPE